MSGTAVVIDTGSLFLKIGFAGDQHPSQVFPNVLGKPKFASGSGEVFIAEEALRRRGILRLTYPVEVGNIKYWEAQETIWQYAFDKSLKVPAPDQPVLLLNNINLKEYISQMATTMFERFHVPSLCIKHSAILSLLQAGRETGVVVESGDAVTAITAVVRGNIHNEARFPIAGADITNVVTAKNVTDMELEVARKIKEHACYVALDYERELATVEPFNLETVPDIGNPDLGIITEERIQAPEMMFKESTTSTGLAEVVCNVICRAPPELRQQMYAGIVLSGGNTLFPGFAERLKKEISSRTADAEVNIIADPERKWYAWAGGSKLASKVDFAESFVSKKEFQEKGPSVFM